jgi:hypothetical protein
MSLLNMPVMKMEPPIGILLTMGQQVIDANGGLLPFIRHFTSCLDGGGYWLQKARMAPKADIAQVYIILQNRIWCRVFYGGYSREATTVWMRTGEQRSFPWPHMILAGPVERSPLKTQMRGFQGFRYVYNPLW